MYEDNNYLITRIKEQYKRDNAIILYEYSILYYSDETFRDKINKLKFKLNTDLHLNYSGQTDISDVNDLGLAHTLNLSGCKYIDDVSALSSVNTLNLNRCDDLTDISMLGNVNTLDISDTYIKDISKLTNVKKLNLSNCLYIRDVSKLDNVIELNMSQCKTIKNINGLKLVEKLNLYNCKRIKDISMLTNVYKLDLRYCKKIKDVGNLRKLKYLCVNTYVEGIHLLKELILLIIDKTLKNLLKTQIKKLQKINKNVKISLIYSQEIWNQK
jgi:hypothetical protein